MGQQLLDGRENAGGGLGDEGGWVNLGLPDHIDLLGALEGVLETALDARGEAGFAAGQLGI